LLPDEWEEWEQTSCSSLEYTGEDDPDGKGWLNHALSLRKNVGVSQGVDMLVYLNA